MCGGSAHLIMAHHEITLSYCSITGFAYNQEGFKSVQTKGVDALVSPTVVYTLLTQCLSS